MLIKSILLLSALVVSFSLPLGEISAPPHCHTHSFSAGVSNKNLKQTKRKRPVQRSPHCSAVGSGSRDTSAFKVPAAVEPLPRFVAVPRLAGLPLPTCFDSDNILWNVRRSRRSPCTLRLESCFGWKLKCSNSPNAPQRWTVEKQQIYVIANLHIVVNRTLLSQ